jgi:dihydrofolate reductase
MTLTIIAAMNAKRVIGNDGSIPWTIPDDMQRFKLLTTGHTVLMGRKTFESIGKVLPGRRNIVISNRPKRVSGTEWFDSIGSALEHVDQDEVVFIIGGGEIFRQTLERADILLLTIVESGAEGDTYFPPYEHLIPSLFTLRTSEQHSGFRYETYIRSGDRSEVR